MQRQRRRDACTLLLDDPLSSDDERTPFVEPGATECSSPVIVTHEDCKHMSYSFLKHVITAVARRIFRC